MTERGGRGERGDRRTGRGREEGEWKRREEAACRRRHAIFHAMLSVYPPRVGRRTYSEQRFSIGRAYVWEQMQAVQPMNMDLKQI